MKKVFAITLVVVLTLGFSSTVLANDPWGTWGRGWCWGYESADGNWGRGLGWCGGFGVADGFWGCPFRDASGSFLSRADVVANLDALVADGTITQAQRDLWLERFDLGFGPGMGRFGGGRFNAGENWQRGGGWQQQGGSRSRGWRWQ